MFHERVKEDMLFKNYMDNNERGMENADKDNVGIDIELAGKSNNNDNNDNNDENHNNYTIIYNHYNIDNLAILAMIPMITKIGRMTMITLISIITMITVITILKTKTMITMISMIITNCTSYILKTFLYTKQAQLYLNKLQQRSSSQLSYI